MRSHDTDESPPPDAAGFRRYWQSVGAPRKIILAVSGGPDSVALMRLAAPLSTEQGVDMLAVTVDHGLRAASANEARQVGVWAKGLGLNHQILKWAGGKPSSGVQEAARRARYRLLAEAAVQGGFEAVLTGHTQDDQAETLFMRLSRGAGVVGLSAMAASSRIAAGAGPSVSLFRPLLEFRRSQLKSLLAEAGQSYLDDPSNDDPAFERVRVRALLAALEEQELLTPSALARSSRRLAEAAEIVQRREEDRFHQLGGVFLRWGGAALKAGGMEPGDAGLIARLVFAVSGAEHLPNDVAAQKAVTQILAGGAATLGGAVLSVKEGTVTIFREGAALTGRAGLAPTPAQPIGAGETVLWDGRFIIRNQTGAAARILAAGALGPAASAAIARPMIHAPGSAEESLPAMIGSDGAVLAVAGDASGAFRSLAAERFQRRIVRFR